MQAQLHLTGQLVGVPRVHEVGVATEQTAGGQRQTVDRAGVRVLRDPYSAKPYVLFYVTKRVGGVLQNFDAIKLLKFGTA